jgi:hypothetical protein
MHPFYILVISHFKLVSGMYLPFAAFFATAVTVMWLRRFVPGASKYVV